MALMYPARHLVLNIGGPAELLALTALSPDLSIVPGVCIRMAEDVLVVDSGIAWCRKIRQVQWMPSRVDYLLAKAIFPLSSAVVLFADSLGDLTQAARVVAGLCRFSPYIDDLLPPSLIVLTVKDCTQETFHSHVTDELLDMLRVEHPHEGHIRHNIYSRWRSRVRSVQIIQKRPPDSWSDIFRSATLTTEERWNCGFGLSERGFQRLCRHAIESYESENFNRLRAFGIHDQVTTAAQNYLTTFIRSLDDIEVEHVETIASCLAVNAYRDDAYVSSPGLVFESLGGRLLQNCAQRSELMRATLGHFLQAVRRHREREISILDQHKQLLRRRHIKLPGCNVCMLKVPTCQLSCLHQLCDFCLAVYDPQSCPRCGASCDPLPARPVAAGVRALGLSGTPGSVLKWLREVREQLSGYIGDFFDIIVCTEECAWLVEDYFVRHVSLPDCSRKLKSRRTWLSAGGPTRSQNCVAIQIGVKSAATYSVFENNSVRARAKRGWDMLLERRGRIKTTIASTIDRECELIWHCVPAIAIKCDSHNAREAVQRMFAGLFYMEVQSLPAKALVPPFTCRLAVKCRLAYGQHLNAAVHTLLEHSIKVYCEVSGTCHRSTLCDAAGWQAYSTSTEMSFAYSIPVTIYALEDDVRVRIDGIRETETALDIANSPAPFFELLGRQSSYNTEVADDEDTATVFTDVGETLDEEISAIQKQLLELM